MKRKIIVLVCCLCLILGLAATASAEELHFSDWVSDTQVNENLASRTFFPETTAFWYVSSRNTQYFFQNQIEFTAMAGHPIYVDIYPFGQDNYFRLDTFKSGGTLSLTWLYDIVYYGGVDFELMPIFTYYDKDGYVIRRDQGDIFTLVDEESIRITEALEFPADAVFFDICFECNSITAPTYNQVLDFQIRESRFIWDYQVNAQNAAQVDNILKAMDKLMYGYEYENFGNIFDDVTSAEAYIWEQITDVDILLEDVTLSALDYLWFYVSAFEFLSGIFQIFLGLELYNMLATISLALGSFALLLGTASVLFRRKE